MIKSPIRIVIVYMIMSLAWIAGSDYLVEIIPSFTAHQYLLHTSKGSIFVIITGLYLYLGIQTLQKKNLRSEEYYKNLFYSNPNPLWIYDQETLNFLEVNDATVRIYGYSREEFKNMSILDIRPVEDHEKVTRAALNLPREYHASGLWQHMKKGGKVFTVAITSHIIEFNNSPCVMTMAQDVTVRLGLEERLKKLYRIEKELRGELESNLTLIKQSLEEKEKLAQVVDRINNLVIITDKFGTITWVNKAFSSFTGYTLNEVCGKSTSFLHGPRTDPATQSHITESLKLNEYPRFEILKYTKSGQEYWAEIAISPIYNEQGQIDRYISIQNIITERKEREEKMRIYNETLRKLAWTNSHAIRKPLASILSLTDLSNDLEQMDEIKEIHSLIRACSQELDAIVKDFGKQVNTIETALF